MTAFGTVPKSAARGSARAHPGGCGRPAPHGPGSRRPEGASPRYRGPAVMMSTAPHRGRAVTPATTVVLALLAAVITGWLGLLAQLRDTSPGTAEGGPPRVPDRLAVVRVEAGETAQHLAARVAPGAPVGQVIERIRELNGVEPAALAAGQTLIAPVG
ncbi:MAG: peptigoglycan-binding protein LysM [Mycobacterium sp.]|uniref:peptigoglycan-binding protein LysM n=1 Tax=Mycobacterium sp. TaxID=1785 RepID=UPI002636E3F0|nr:peptigoglycan-binding protein LysM [Mycobacterium sp.]MDI3314439.1 peptigoglycan-binding protein LysM [Mycobacterium sp.]